MDYATTLVAAVLLGVGFVLQQYAARQEPESRFLSWRILTDLLRKPRWLVGIACMVAGQLLAAWSLGHLELTLVEPLLTTYLLFALILAVPLSKQAVRWTEVTGALLLCAGVTLLSVSRSTKPIGAVVRLVLALARGRDHRRASRSSRCRSGRQPGACPAPS